MKTKLLLFFILLALGSALRAQDTIRTLIITEERMDRADHAYVELTNVGTDTLKLNQFELGTVGPWNTRNDLTDLGKWFIIPSGFSFMLPDWKLAPGKSIVLAEVCDWAAKMWRIDPDHYGPVTKPEMWKLADIQVNVPEAPTQPNPLDSVSSNYNAMVVWNGRDCWYVRHHINDSVAVVVDQVGGVFDQASGLNHDGAYDVAGVTNATFNCILVRKNTVKKGNINFNSGRGTTLSESEWIPVPTLFTGPNHYEVVNRAVFWTVGNQGNYHLSSLTSNTLDISWANSTITVPWGIRNDDSIIYQFHRVPGIAWHYDYAGTYEDSAYTSIRTGDVLTLYACGDSLEVIPMKLKVAAPTADANIVIPKKRPDSHLYYYNNVTQNHAAPFCQVTDKVPGMDTIRGNELRGIAFATPVDTLFKYLEKAPKAKWEIVWVDGQKRTDLQNGDILKVTAENSAVKEYYIKVDQFRPAHNAYLASITWPDIPQSYKGLYGWMGDTIPNFMRTNYDYIVQVPSDVIGIPALVAKNEDLNAKLSVQRAISLVGTAADKTITFTSTATDDTTVRVYRVQLQKLKDVANIQSYSADPFVSQFVWWEMWANVFVELDNPGNQPLDMSKYMFVSRPGPALTPADAIRAAATTSLYDWQHRYTKYIPGMKWAADSTSWKVAPAMAIQDLNVNPIVQPGDVFVMGQCDQSWALGYPWWASKACDIDFAHNPWGEPTISGDQALCQWYGNWFLFRIDNDSVRNGLKAATDPNDFTLIDVFGSGDGTEEVVGGRHMEMINGYERKPQYYKGTPEYKGSFGTDDSTSQWIWTDQAYWDARNAGWPNDILFVANGLGQHFMNEVTVYKSTISSNVYKLTEGYSMNESLWGVVTGTMVADFKNNILKADTGQVLKVRRHNTGFLADTAKLVSNDTLVVISADKKNTSQYALTVTAEGLNHDAVLTSTLYTINVTGSTGTVSNFHYGTLLKDVVDNVNVPTGASLTIIDANGAYVPFKFLNFDTVYVDTKVSDKIFFEVVAEDGTTKIVYQLTPNATSSDAFVTSDIYSVDQETCLIGLIPEGTTVWGLTRFLTPAPGATFMLVDKYGLERTMGYISKDDKLVVTAADGMTTKTYYLTELNVKTTYLAYVLSNVYSVNQVGLKISGSITDNVDVTTFLGNLIPAEGASIKVLDSLGVENNGFMGIGNVLQVTAGDGATIVYYSIDVSHAVSVNKFIASQIYVYPNPTSGLVTISGIDAGNKIIVSNLVGQKILTRIVNRNKETISLEGQAKGIYFIEVSSNDKLIGRLKLIMN